MDAVGDGIHAIFGEHVLGHLGVLLGDAVDVVAQVERQVGHVEHVRAADRVGADGRPIAPPQDVVGEAGDQGVGLVEVNVKRAHQPPHHLDGELIVPGGHRGVRGEDALLPDCVEVLGHDGRTAGFPGLLVEEFDGQQAGVAFVHMEARQLVVSQRAQHPHTADAQDGFLAEPVPRVAPVEMIRQFPVPLRVLGQVAVQ